MPVGSTMYVWGGGWNDEDTGAGQSAVTIGIDKRWESFFKKCGSDYDFKTCGAPRACGLDCSGFVGWSIYNAINTENNLEGFVFKSRIIGYKLADMGMGECIENFSERRKGDILFNDGHVWICMESFSDGSVEIIHSSPPGVMVNGAPRGSIAHEKADKYMRRFHEWYKKYPVTFRNEDYLKNYKLFRFY